MIVSELPERKIPEGLEADRHGFETGSSDEHPLRVRFSSVRKKRENNAKQCKIVQNSASNAYNTSELPDLQRGRIPICASYCNYSL
jgi:hypothetical protein